jgi:hypothetical protein
MLSHLCSAQNSNCRRTTQDVCEEGTSVARPREDGLHTYPSATMLFELFAQSYTFFAFAIQMNKDSTFLSPYIDKETGFSGAKHSFTFASIVSMMSPFWSDRKSQLHDNVHRPPYADDTISQAADTNVMTEYTDSTLEMVQGSHCFYDWNTLGRSAPGHSAQTRPATIGIAKKAMGSPTKPHNRKEAS